MLPQLLVLLLLVLLVLLLTWWWWAGCGCKKDWGSHGWGAVGFPRLTASILAKARGEWSHPNAKGVLSTWHFGGSKADEYGGLDAWLRANNNDSAWTNIMAAVPSGFTWVEKHGGVGGLPTLDFPEYSMFSGCPWGGKGANPIPTAVQQDWAAHANIITGGMPYQEGIYLDMNVVLRQQLYWSGRPTNESLADFVRFNFGRAALEPVTKAVLLVEKTTHKPDATSQQALDLLTTAELRMTAAARQSWRWRVLFLRALIDATVFNGTTSGSALLNASFAELDRMYYVERDCCDTTAEPRLNCSAQAGAPRLLTNCTILALRPGLSGDVAGEC